MMPHTIESAYSTKLVSVRRDSFARQDLMRFVRDSQHCSWCGAQRGVEVRTLYGYLIRTDSFQLRLHPYDGAFCNMTCAEAYHGGRLL